MSNWGSLFNILHKQLCILTSPSHWSRSQGWPTGRSCCTCCSRSWTGLEPCPDTDHRMTWSWWCKDDITNYSIVFITCSLPWLLDANMRSEPPGDSLGSCPRKLLQPRVLDRPWSHHQCWQQQTWLLWEFWHCHYSCFQLHIPGMLLRCWSSSSSSSRPLYCKPWWFWISEAGTRTQRHNLCCSERQLFCHGPVQIHGQLRDQNCSNPGHSLSWLSQLYCLFNDLRFS